LFAQVSKIRHDLKKLFDQLQIGSRWELSPFGFFTLILSVIVQLGA
jgi:hypothetical protein